MESGGCSDRMFCGRWLRVMTEVVSGKEVEGEALLVPGNSHDWRMDGDELILEAPPMACAWRMRWMLYGWPWGLWPGGEEGGLDVEEVDVGVDMVVGDGWSSRCVVCSVESVVCAPLFSMSMSERGKEQRKRRR